MHHLFLKQLNYAEYLLWTYLLMQTMHQTKVTIDLYSQSTELVFLNSHKCFL